MNRISSKFNDIFSSIPTVMKYIIVGLSIIIISFLFPNNVKFKYEYQKGMPWRYNDLYAPYDFAIKKSGEELNKEIDEIKNQSPLYFRMEKSIIDEVLNNYSIGFDNKFNPNQLDTTLENTIISKQSGQRIIREIMLKGIIDTDTLELDPQKVISLIIDNNSKKVSLSSINNIENAKKYLRNYFNKSSSKSFEFQYNLIANNLKPNVFYDSETTKKYLDDKLRDIAENKGIVHKNELIVLKGASINEETFQKIESFKYQYQQQLSSNKSDKYVYGGYLLLTLMVIGIFLLYLFKSTPKIFSSFKDILFLLFWIVLYSYIVYLVEQFDNFSPYIIPFAIAPIVIKNFHGKEIALFTHMIIILIASFITSLGFEFTFIQLMVGIVVILTSSQTRYWKDFFISIGFIFGVYLFSYFGLELIKEGNIYSINWSMFKWFPLNAFFILLAYPIIPLFEKIFGYISDITLAELSDVGLPLLKELSSKTPGTFQHSLQVANISESVAQGIGANALLIKVGALYHDIGKMKYPLFFIENQSGTSPHDDLDPLDSAKYIIEHVNEGKRLAKKYNLPKPLVRFITTHHGTTSVHYFLTKYNEKYPDKEFDDSLFRYPGPKPASKEEAILMIVDSIEAACKSIKEPNIKNLNAMVESIVRTKLSSNQLDEADITFAELTKAKEIIKRNLHSIYHVRIEYPK